MTGVRPLATRRGDDGQLLLLVLGCTLIVALLLTVVVDASRVFLAQRALSAAADAAALAGADAVDEAAFYDHSGDVTRGGVGGGRELVPLDDAAARQAVDGYVTAAGLPSRFDDLVVSTALGRGGTSVTVTCSARVRLPFVNVVSAGHAEGYLVGVTASARSPLRP